MRFHRIVDDFSIKNRWYLGEPVCGEETIDARTFLGCLQVELPKGPCSIPVQQGSLALDFTLAAFDMPVVTARVAALISDTMKGSGIQFIEVEVEGKGGYYIMNVLSMLDVIDLTRTEHSTWTELDKRPDKVGQLRAVYGLRIRPEAAFGNHLFRLAGWKIAMIASESLKTVLEVNKVSGIKFTNVS